MDIPDKALVDVLTYLLPGFITTAILHNLTPAPRPIPFERVIQALIFTIVVQAFIVPLREALFFAGTSGWVIGRWTSDVLLMWSVSLATLLGLVITYLANSDRLHALLRLLRITQQTSYSSEWYGALCQNRAFVVLHLIGERRLYGWPEEWPSDPGSGHFVIAQAEWLDGDQRIEISGVEKLLIRASDVEMVELMNAHRGN